MKWLDICISDKSYKDLKHMCEIVEMKPSEVIEKLIYNEHVKMTSLADTRRILQSMIPKGNAK